MTDPEIMVVRRLADLTIDQCTECGEQVAVFPAGRLAKQRMPWLRFVCMHCQPPEAGDVGLSAVLP